MWINKQSYIKVFIKCKVQSKDESGSHIHQQVNRSTKCDVYIQCNQQSMMYTYNVITQSYWNGNSETWMNQLVTKPQILYHCSFVKFLESYNSQRQKAEW